MGLFSSSGPTQNEKREKYNEQRKYATSLIAKHRKDIQAKTAEYEMIANSQYAYYGWRGCIAFSLFGTSMLVGERIPVFRTYMSWVGLLGGYFIGNYAHGLHIAHQMKAVVAEIDVAVNTLKPLHEKYGVPHEEVVGGETANAPAMGMLGGKPGAPKAKPPAPPVTYTLPGLTEYNVEITALKSMREHLAPSDETIQKQEAAAAAQAMTLDDRVDAILASYTAKKQSA